VVHLTILTAPLVANPGLPLPSAPIVELRDQAGQAVRTAGIVVTASVSTGTLSGTTVVYTDAQGRARFTDLTLDGTIGKVELHFTCCGLAPVSRSLSLSLIEPSIQRQSPNSMTGYAGDTLSPGPRVLLTDERKQPRAGATVRWEFDSSAVRAPVTVVTGADGIATLPSFQFGDLPSATSVTAIDVATGKSVDYTLQATVRGKVYLQDTISIVGAGEAVTLPPVSVYDELTDPVLGALVRYRVTSGDGVLSTAEAHTDADGVAEPVTLSTTSRGSTTIEIIAVGYSERPILQSVFAVDPPLSVEYASPCELDCITSFNFTRPLMDGPAWNMDVFFKVRVRDATGPVPGYPISLAKDSAAPYFWVDMDGLEFLTPEKAPLVTDAMGVALLAWRLPQAIGTYSFTMSGPLMDTPWSYTATVE
jgi:hypothetical protein